MIIQHNMVAMFSSTQLGITNNRKAKTTEKLSSGYRVNRASDDAAGLAISEKVRSQVRGLKRASQNAQDGISLVQTADGALGEIHSIIHRMRELHVQGANDVNSSEDRAKIQDEIDQLTEEIDGIATRLEFNKKKLLDGSYGDAYEVAVPVTCETLDGESVSLSDIESMDGINIIYVESVDDSFGAFSTEQSAYDAATISGYDNLKNVLQKEIVPQAVKSLVSIFPNTFGYLSGSSIGIGLKLYNAPSSSTMASVSIGYWTKGDGTFVSDNIIYNLSVNMGYLALTADGGIVNDPDNQKGRSALETTIVHEMTHAVMDEALTNGMVGGENGAVNSANQFPKWFKEGMAQAAAGAASQYNDWIAGMGLGPDSTIEQIKAAVTNSNAKLSSGTSTANYGTGYLACMYLGYLAGGKTVSASAIAGGLDTIMSRIRDGKSLNEMIDEYSDHEYASAAALANKFGDDDSAAFVKSLLQAIGDNGGGGLAKGNLTAIDILDDAEYNTNLFKLDITSTYVKNVYPETVPKFTDGGLGGVGDPNGTGSPAGEGGVPDGPTYSTDEGAWIQLGANKEQGMTIHIGDMRAAALGVVSLSVADHIVAGQGLETLDQALEKVSAERSRLGAYQNRLEYTIRVDDIAAENMQSAESRIRDADMAEEITRFAKENILSQAGISILSQANQSGQLIQKLLQ